MAGFGTSSSDGSLPEEVRVQVDDALRRVEEKVAAAVAAAEAEAEREGPEDEDEDEDEDEARRRTTTTCRRPGRALSLPRTR